MRVDLFMKRTGLVKRRSIIQDMCSVGVILINEKVVKSSCRVKVGDVIKIKLLNSVRQYRVLKIPSSNYVPKESRHIYTEEVPSSC